MALAEVMTEVPDWTFGERLRKARRHAGLSQVEMAHALGLEKHQRYSNWEADLSKPRDLIDVCKRVEQITGFPADWLAGLRSRCFSVVPPVAGQLELAFDTPPPRLLVISG